MNAARWTATMVGALALACAGNSQGRSSAATARNQPNDTMNGGGANATASNAEAASQRPSQGAGSLDPHPTVTNRDDPQFKGEQEAKNGEVQRPGQEGRTALPQDQSARSGQSGNATSSGLAKSEVKELPDVRGQVGRVSSNEITIRKDGGETLKLKIDPQLTTVDGQQNGLTSLKEGDEVRASYEERKGDKIAVDIHRAGSGDAGAPSTGGMNGGAATDSTGTSGSGTSGSSTSGSSAGSAGSGSSTGSSSGTTR